MTASSALVDRLVALPKLSHIPRAELEWLVERGAFEVREPGAVLAPVGQPARYMWIVLTGQVSVEVDRGAGPRLVVSWRSGEVTGMLPYSRMKGPPGNNYVTERSELLAVSVEHFQAMAAECPTFTAHTVHSMLDRARSFRSSELQDEKMVSLGKLAAGLAHELNNPASATVRGAKQLLDALSAADSASRALGAAGLSEAQYAAIEQLRATCLAQPGGGVLSAIEQSDRTDAIAAWLAAHAADQAWAEVLADTSVTLEALDDLATALSGATLEAALRWIAAGCSTHALARDIQQAAGRIHDLVAAVKRFTYMDALAGPEPMDIEPGIRDTVRVVASKARAKGAAVTIEVAPDLPAVRAIGSELNQIWLNLLDNALDAIGQGGRVTITARRELDRVVVTVVDDGPGIPPDILPHIFDPFFTTKPPGEGTGMGLEISRRLLRQIQGDLTATSEPGHTEFRVRLHIEESASHPSGTA